MQTLMIMETQLAIEIETLFKTKFFFSCDGNSDKKITKNNNLNTNVNEFAHSTKSRK